MSLALLLQERSRQTRKSIMAAADQLWRLHDLDAVSVLDVCEAAGVAKGSFYNYFPSKDHLLVMLVFSRMTPTAVEINEIWASDRTTLEQCLDFAAIVYVKVRQLEKPLVRRGVDASFQHYRDIEALYGGQRGLSWHLRPIFLRGQTRGEVDADWDPDILAATLSWATLQAIANWSIGGQSDEQFEARLLERVELVVAGAGAKRSRAARPAKSKSRSRQPVPLRQSEA